ncbi:VpsP family polysaccharide biosynthesis protein [Brumicola pallidula]|uniref:Uncharacterized protein n=1 Tax=Brumicola pallidula DSM 14239 = ACAM 615 TaxID=1121922 RepID=K6ZFQ8_9ALTE|nr:VpsP family polysaccharide biosynthesis protein [Glaciecola pallidula]GAC29197.1 hypothetical protein GPAL_2336 [Glaciecola pallidula DSM 14239 = ACAM 615]
MQTKLTQQISYALLTCRKYLFVFAFGLISLLGLYNATNYGLANLHFYSAQNAVLAWHANNQLDNEESYNNAAQSAYKARNQHPAHPLYTDLSAQIYEWGVIGGYEDASVALAISKELYIKATKMRPTWPVTYASLAMNKWRSNEFDAELLNYLTLANKYGPKKAEVNILFVEMGLALYQNNKPFYTELRPYIKQRISQGIRNSQSQTRVLAAIEHYGAKRTVCRWMRESGTAVSNSIIKCVKS